MLPQYGPRVSSITFIYSPVHFLLLFSFLQVNDNEKLLSWLNDAFIPGVFAGRWYNGKQESQTVYIGNKHSVLVGMARARQLRIKPSKFLSQSSMFFGFRYIRCFTRKGYWPFAQPPTWRARCCNSSDLSPDLSPFTFRLTFHLQRPYAQLSAKRIGEVKVNVFQWQ